MEVRPFFAIIMTISHLLKKAKAVSANRDDFLSIEVLLAYVLTKDRAYLFAHGEEQFGQSAITRFEGLFQRFIKGEPLAYLTNGQEFYGLHFFVDKRVLIPRPETEMLVEKTLDFLSSQGGGFIQKVVDVGTGSGCIAVSIAKFFPSAILTATDISSDALDVALKNAQMHGVATRINFLRSDLLVNLPGNYDVVVANMPYIGTKRFSFISKAVKEYEPGVALFGGDDGMKIYEKLFEQLASKPWKPKLFIGEFGFLQRDEMDALLQRYFPRSKINYEEDAAHIDRMFVVESQLQ